jgi:hypothetical protein
VLRANLILAYVFLVLGGAIALRTALLGGGQVGFLVAAVFLVLGWLRLRAARG